MPPALLLTILLTALLAVIILGPTVSLGLRRLRDYIKQQNEDVNSIWKE